MRTSTFLTVWAVLIPACSSEDASETNATGGAAGASGASTGGSAGSSGASAGGASTGGSSTGGASTGGTPSTGGSSTGGGGSDAGMSGSGGTDAGSGGASSGAGGSGGGAGAGGKGGAGAGGGSGGNANSMMNFFVTSDTSMTADLDGTMGADARCQRLAMAVGAGSKTWRAYLSTMNPVTNARDRIGEGPYYNSQGALLAMTKDALHMRSGDPALFIDERGGRINGQWAGSPTPNQHDVLTGSTAMGMLSSGNTCGDWNSTTGMSFVGHTDGLGPNMNANPPYNQWAGSHTGQCGDTAPGGGAGRLYCFVGP
jgi:hypothetical protein